MPVYGLAGVSTTQRSARLQGLVAVVVCIALSVGLTTWVRSPAANTIHLALLTSELGDGIVSGAVVRANGVAVGRVERVESLPDLSQKIVVALDGEQLGGLTDAMTVRYAPSNLFGISDVVLDRASGGVQLSDDMTVDLRGQGRVTDATMGSLLRHLAALSTDVITPDLTAALRRSATAVRAFTPLMEAVVAVGTAVADTQRYDSSFLVRQYAEFFHGVGSFGDGFIKLIDHVSKIRVLRENRAKFDIGADLVIDELLPQIGTVLGSIDRGAGDYLDALVPVVEALAQTVPEPERSHAELTELLNRLDRTFVRTKHGVVVSVDVALLGAPGVGVPLRRIAGTTGGTR